MQGRVIKCARWSHRTLGKANWFRNSVGIESRSLNIPAPRPEASAAYLMGVGLLCHRVGSRARRGAPARKARDGEIEAAPKEMHGAALADKPGAKLFEDAVDSYQNSPKAMHVLRVIRAVDTVLVETDGIGDFDWHGPDLHLDAERMEQVHELRVELSHGARNQRQRPSPSFSGQDIEFVVYEVELNFEGLAFVRNGGSGQAAGVDIKRYFPPVIEMRT